MYSAESLAGWVLKDPKAAAVEIDRADVARHGLKAFVKLGWRTVEGDKPFVSGWHLDAISDHLEAVSGGGLRKLIINIPPRHMKSTQVAVMWPAWDWIAKPWRQWLFASYAQNLSIRDSVKCRRVIESPWYQSRWDVTLTGDQNTKLRFENDAGGYRLATSVDGTLTGEGGDIICIDDAHNVRDVESDAVRQSTLDWWDEAMSTRLNDPRAGAYVVIMQRVHERDLTGHILAREHGWDHLCLPARYERLHPFPVRSSLGWTDPRTREGQLLWSERFGEKEIAELEGRLREKASGQLQQRPSPAGGGIIKRDWFRKWPKGVPFPRFHYVVQSWDTAHTEKTNNDPTAFSVWGVFEFDGRFNAMLIDCDTEHLEVPDLLPRVLKEFKMVYGASVEEDEYGAPLIKPPHWRKNRSNGRSVDCVLIEDKGSGIGIRQSLERQKVPVKAYNPGRLDKVARAHLVTPVIQDGLIWIPESSKRPGQFVDWAEPFVRECEAFPNGAHDDLVDTGTQALRLLTDMRFLVLKADDDYDPEPVEEPMERMNPYAM